MLRALVDVLREHVPLELRGVDVDVRQVHRDSRRIEAGDLFAALPGSSVDGSAFARAACERGAVAVLAARETDAAVPHLIATDAREAMAWAAHALCGHPTQQLAVVGITGTNGKTTTAWILDGVLRALGHRTALLGTVAQRVGDEVSAATFTTLEADDLARFARRAVDADASHLVMEVSSHGLVQHRVTGVTFDVAAFTNLTQDHLDFHESMEAYGEAKATLFVEHAPRASVIHVDSQYGATLANRATGTVLRCSVSPDAADAVDFAVEQVAFASTGIRATLRTPIGSLAIDTPIVGKHNLENLLTVLGIVHALGGSLQEAAAALRTVTAAPGRLEPVADPRGVGILVDYAHTPDALASVLAAVRPMTDGKLIVVFGCGGDRDRAKRPLMGRAASEGADVAIVTSDNPRTEDPAAIIAEILPGLRGARMDALARTEGWFVEADRARAIELAVQVAEPGDTVLIAGKGHEDYQIIGTEKRAFDDREVARRAVEALR